MENVKPIKLAHKYQIYTNLKKVQSGSFLHIRLPKDLRLSFIRNNQRKSGLGEPRSFITPLCLGCDYFSKSHPQSFGNIDYLVYVLWKEEIYGIGYVVETEQTFHKTGRSSIKRYCALKKVFSFDLLKETFRKYGDKKLEIDGIKGIPALF